MAREIERKFIVDPNKLPKLPRCVELEQGYICDAPEVRIRIEKRDGYFHSWVTIKSPKAELDRQEVESEISNERAKEMLKMCTKTVRKTRYVLMFDKFQWSVDHYYELGFWMAEIELDEKGLNVPLPPWVDAEVTGMQEYYARNLAK